MLLEDKTMVKVYTKRFKEDAEEDKSKKAIKDLIELKWSYTEEEKGKASNLLKGLLYADNPVANKFLKALDEFTSSLDENDYV